MAIGESDEVGGSFERDIIINIGGHHAPWRLRGYWLSFALNTLPLPLARGGKKGGVERGESFKMNNYFQEDRFAS